MYARKIVHVLHVYELCVCVHELFETETKTYGRLLPLGLKEEESFVGHKE